jgi:hypothetical protein
MLLLPSFILLLRVANTSRELKIIYFHQVQLPTLNRLPPNPSTPLTIPNICHILQFQLEDKPTGQRLGWRGDICAVSPFTSPRTLHLQPPTHSYNTSLLSIIFSLLYFFFCLFLHHQFLYFPHYFMAKLTKV